MLRVWLFGGLRLERDGLAIDLPASRRARELLAWLALNPGRHPRAGVAARFWPDVLDSSARASLRTTLHELRAGLGEAAASLVADRESLALETEGVWTDTRAFDELAAADRIVEALELAAAGDVLAGLEADWAHEARDVWRERLVALHERLALAAEQGSDTSEMVRRTREQVRLDPNSEEATRRLMQRLASAGDRPAALEAYARLEQRLGRDLRVAPSQPTRELARSLRTTESAARADEPVAPALQLPLPPALRRREQSGYVGREAVVVRLREALADVEGGERRTVLLAGEPGIGKTRLLTEICRAAHAEGAVVLFGRCYEEALTPYQAFIEALAEYVRAGGPLPAGPGAAELARLAPELAGAGEAPPLTGDPEGARYRLFESVRGVLVEAARGGPAIVAIDDLHWADSATLHLLAHLVRSAEPSRLLVVGTYRESELSRTHPLAAALADLRREALIERIALHGLDPSDVATLVTSWLGPTAPPELARALDQETGGNPFFLEEVLSHLAETGTILPSQGTWVERSPIEELGVPESVKEVLGRRLSRLSEACNRVLAAAAVVGRNFDLDVLTELAELRNADPLEALEEAVAAQLVREDPAMLGRYGFAHPLVRETLHEELSLVRRVRLHGEVAAAIERLYAHDLEPHLSALAAHRLAAAAGGDPRPAVDVALRAARRCMAQLAYEEAAAVCGDLVLALGDARLRLGDQASAREAFAAAATVARELESAELLARAALGHSGLGVTIIAVDEATVALLSEALSTLPGDGPLRARLLARLTIATYYASAPAERKALGDESVAIARRAGDDRALLEALNARRASLWSSSFLEERLTADSEMIEAAERAGDVEGILQGRNWRVADLHELGDLDAMRAEIEAHEELADHLRLPPYQWWAPMWRSTLAILEGRLEDAERLIEQYTALGLQTRDANAELHTELQCLALSEARERFAEIDDERLRSERGRPAEGAWRTTYAWIYASQGRVEAGRECLDWVAADGFVRLREDMNELSSLAELAQALTALEQPEHASVVYQRLLPYAGRNVSCGRAASGYGSASLHLGTLAVLMGRPEIAADHFERALVHNEAMNAGVFLARTRLAYGELLLSSGGEDRAGDLLALAASGAERMGIAPLAKRARTAAAR
jgi:DNA-binding SARP family transcriptional activator/tetratricopeptide (TPR) repeat protein